MPILFAKAHSPQRLQKNNTARVRERERGRERERERDAEHWRERISVSFSVSRFPLSVSYSGPYCLSFSLLSLSLFPVLPLFLSRYSFPSSYHYLYLSVVHVLLSVTPFEVRMMELPFVLSLLYSQSQPCLGSEVGGHTVRLALAACCPEGHPTGTAILDSNGPRSDHTSTSLLSMKKTKNKHLIRISPVQKQMGINFIGDPYGVISFTWHCSMCRSVCYTPKELNKR